MGVLGGMRLRDRARAEQISDVNARREAETIRGIVESRQKSADIASRLPTMLTGTTPNEQV